jgi:hypothetical protein
MRKIIEKYSEKPNDLFKKMFFTFLFGYLPFTVLHIILNVTGVIPVNFNDEQIYGLKGVAIIILFTPLFVLMITFFVWLYFIFGNFVLRTIKKMFYE